jgi:hypothetical protein
MPDGGSLVAVSCRTVQGRYLLCPNPVLDEIILGVLGRAQRIYPLDICGFAFLSNHYHLLVWVEDSERLAQFMGYFNSNLAREVARLVDWPDKIWARRYDAIVMSDEAAAQVDRLRYVLAQGCKEGLVASPGEWPGIHMVPATLKGRPLTGYWFDRTKEYGARLRCEEFDRLAYATEESVVLSAIPCWRHLSPEQYQERLAELVGEIESEAAAEREQTGREPLGTEAVLKQSPHTRPNRVKSSPSPMFHAASKAARRALWALYGEILTAFRTASEQLKAGDRRASFPIGSFPPGLPFVRALPDPAAS